MTTNRIDKSLSDSAGAETHALKDFDVGNGVE